MHRQPGFSFAKRMPLKAGVTSGHTSDPSGRRRFHSAVSADLFLREPGRPCFQVSVSVSRLVFLIASFSIQRPFVRCALSEHRGWDRLNTEVVWNWPRRPGIYRPWSRREGPTTGKDGSRKRCAGETGRPARPRQLHSSRTERCRRGWNTQAWSRR